MVREDRACTEAGEEETRGRSQQQVSPLRWLGLAENRAGGGAELSGLEINASFGDIG